MPRVLAFCLVSAACGSRCLICVVIALQAGYYCTRVTRGCGAGRGDLRLSLGGASDDGNAGFGRLEIFDRGGWGSVCEFTRPSSPRLLNSAPLTASAINVACQQLGFQSGEKTQIFVRRR